MNDDPYHDAPRLPGQEPLDPRSLFAPSDRPVELEIGPGRGWFLVERLEAEPGICALGLEVRRKWATIVDGRLRQRGLGDRGRVFAEDVRAVLPRLLSESLQAVFVHFPDPWWKKRHAKRRVLTASLVQQIARVLRPGGELFVQTDVIERAEQFERLASEEPRLAAWGATPRVDVNPYNARSPRERRALEDGLPIVRLRYRRLGGPGSPGALP